MEILGFRDGFRGLVEDRKLKLDKSTLAGILTVGGTILGTSRDKPHRMVIDGRTRDMTKVIVENFHKYGLDALVCLGGGGTQKNALRLHEAGLNVITLPKTIDNDVAMTDATFGFATAMDIATETIDRLHSTAHSHHRIVVAEIMGHRAGWLTLGAGIAGGADVILIPEIPYDVEKIAEAIKRRSRHGTNFSIVAVAEGAMSKDDARALPPPRRNSNAPARCTTRRKPRSNSPRSKCGTGQHHAAGEATRGFDAARIARDDSRLRPARRHARAADRLLATRLGSACGDLIHEGVFGVMVAARGDGTEPVPLEKVAGRRKSVPPDHPWVETARHVGTCMGD